METRQQMIEDIYKEIANKELSFGCRIQSDTLKVIWFAEPEILYLCNGEAVLTDKTEIKGHPVKIGDVLDWNEINNGNKFDRYSGFIETIWKKKRLPIDDQSEECIKYIYNLTN